MSKTELKGEEWGVLSGSQEHKLRSFESGLVCQVGMRQGSCPDIYILFPVGSGINSVVGFLQR